MTATTVASPDASPSTPTRGLILHDAEVRQLLALGSVLVIRPIVPQPQESFTTYEDGSRRSYGWSWQRVPHHSQHHPVNSAGMLAEAPFRAGEERFVREAWFNNLPEDQDLQHVYYRADPDEPDFDGETIEQDGGGWRSAQHMPEWASRARVRCEEVRALRLDELPLAPPLRQCWCECYGKRYPGSPWVWAVSVTLLPSSGAPLAALAEGGAE